MDRYRYRYMCVYACNVHPLRHTPHIYRIYIEYIYIYIYIYMYIYIFFKAVVTTMCDVFKVKYFAQDYKLY